MGRFCGVLVIFLSVLSVRAQQPSWRNDADKYLKTIYSGDLELEGPDLLDKLRSTLAAGFRAGGQDVRLTQLLVGLDPGAPDAGKYIQAVQASLQNKPLQKAVFLLDLAASTKAGDIQTALTLLESARHDSSALYVCALRDYARAQLTLGNYAGALGASEKALALASYKPGNSSELYNSILFDVADFYIASGKSEQSVEFREKAEQHRRDQLGVNLPEQMLFRESGILPGSVVGSKSEFADQVRIALIYWHAGFNEYKKFQASALLQDAANSQGKKNDLPAADRAEFFFRKALIDLDVNNSSAAISDLTAAIAAFESAGKTLSPENKTDYYNSRNIMGCALFAEARYPEASKVFRQLKQDLESAGLTRQNGNQLNHNLILTSARMNGPAQLRALIGPLTISGGANHWNPTVEQLEKYGDLMYSQADHAIAYRLYSKAYTTRWAEAQSKYDPEQAKANQDGSGNEVVLLHQENVLVNIGVNGVVNEIYPYKPSGDDYIQLLTNISKAALATGDYANARKYLIEYINEYYTRLDNLHQNHSVGSDLYEIYRLKSQLFPAYDLFLNLVMNDAAASSGTVAEDRMRGFTYLLDSKANLQYELRHIRNTIENGKDQSLKKAYGLYLDNRNQLAKMKLSGADRQQLEALALATDTLQAYLSKRTQIMLPMDKKFVFWKDIQKSLGRNEAAIEIKRFQKYDSGRWTNQVVYAAFIITPVSRHPQVVFLKDGNLLEGKAFKFYQNSIRQKLENTRSYYDYWGPIQEQLPGINKVFISGDGVYNQVNLNTLFNTKSKKYLIDELQIYQVINTKELHLRKDVYKRIKKATLMGRPSYYIGEPKSRDTNPQSTDPRRAITRAQVASGQITDLPGTEKEIAAVDKILRGQRVITQTFVGAEATEAAFKKSANSDILHIATHGFWFHEDPALEREDAMLNSGLLLAGVKNYFESATGTEDGILTAYELQGMSLDSVSLALLSACETGLGHNEAGEGVYGLQRALHIAGVDKIIMSLWKVDDDATQELFTLFYQNWVNKAGLAQSFQKAQVKLREKYKDPYYWGAFVLVE